MLFTVEESIELSKEELSELAKTKYNETNEVIQNLQQLSKKDSLKEAYDELLILSDSLRVVKDTVLFNKIQKTINDGVRLFNVELSSENDITFAELDQHLSEIRDGNIHEVDLETRSVQRNAFDLDAVRLRYHLSTFANQLKDPTKFGTLDQTNSDFITLSNFYKAFTTIELMPSLVANRDETVKTLGTLLNKWAQRSLELLDINKTMKSVDQNTDFKLFFNGDTLLSIFKDAKTYYTDKNSMPITGYKFNAAELVLGDIYMSKFNRDFNDSVYEIKQQGSAYFENRIAGDYSDDDTKADIKLHLNNHDRPVYIRYTDKLPGNDYRLNISLERPLEEEGVQQRFVRRNQKGEILYTIPDHKNIRVRLEDDKEIIYVRAATSVKFKEELLYDKVPDFDKNLTALLNSFKGNIRSFVPLINNDLKMFGLSENKQGRFKSNKITFNQTTLNAFSKFSGYSTAKNNIPDD